MGYLPPSTVTSNFDPNYDCIATTAYNALGLRTVMTDTTGVTTWVYDGLSQPVAITQPRVGTVGYNHNAQGNRTRLIYPDGKQALYAYDSLGRLAQVTDWLTQTTTYTYNAASWLVNTSLPNGVTITNTYDDAGQLLEREHARNAFLISVFQYVYNETGNRTVVTETLFSPYHLLLPVVMHSTSEGEQMMQGESLAPQLSPLGPYPAPLDAGVESEQSAPTPAAPGPYPAPEAEPGDDETSFWQGLMDFIGELLGWDATTASAHPATAPALSGLASETQTIPSGVSQSVIEYTYDPLSRLTAADYSDGIYFHYTLDAVGNQLSEATPAGETAYVYDDANRLENVDGETYNWDANGNLTWIGSWTHPYFYDAANRLIGAGGMTLTASYSYSGLGDRVSQTVGGDSIQYTLDLAAGLTQVLGDNDHVYLYGLGRIAQQGATTTEYFLTDALGSVRQLVVGDGEVTLAKRYEPFGETLSSVGDGISTFAYTGEAMDALTGFVYLRARYMDPSQGRFLSRDIWVGDYSRPLSLNLWNYVESNPVIYVDHTGHIKESDASTATSIIDSLFNNYSVSIFKDYRFYDVQVPQVENANARIVKWKCEKAWYEGAWENLHEIEWVRDAIEEMGNAMGGAAKFKAAMHGTVKISRWDVSRDPILTINGNEIIGSVRGFAPPPEAGLGDIVMPDHFFSAGDLYAKYGVVHELAHVWDRRSGKTLSEGISAVVGTKTVCNWLGFNCRYDLGIADGNEPPPGHHANPYAGVSAMEDWAEAFATFVYPAYYGQDQGNDILGPIRRQYVQEAIQNLQHR